MPKVLAQYDLSKIPVKGLVPESGATAPTSPANGQFWYDTSVHKLKVYQNGAWVILDLDTNTTYATGVLADVNTGTSTTASVWSPKTIKDAIVANSPVSSVAGRTGAVVLTKSDVGLSAVDNTSDANKPISTAQASVNSAKADLASPVFTGDPKAPTPTAGDNDTSIATTAFVQTAVSPKANSANPTFTGTVTVPTPTSGTAAANKDYVDNAIQGLDAKASVRVATTGNITLSGLQSIDAITLVAGDRVLVKDQTNSAQNGIYVAASGAWARSSDMNILAEAVSAFVFVEEGLVNKETGWLSGIDANGQLDTSILTWYQFSSAGVISAGAGLFKNGSVISIATNGVTSDMLADGAIDLTDPLLVYGPLPVEKGGTGSSTAAGARFGISAVGKALINIPQLTPGTWVSLPLPSAFSYSAPLVKFADATTNEEVILDSRFDVQNILYQVRSDVAVAANALYAIFMDSGI